MTMIKTPVPHAKRKIPLIDELPSHDVMRDVKGRKRTMSLFYETNVSSLEAEYTTKDYNHVVGEKTYISIYLIYMELADPTEYEFAKLVFGSWQHWERICRADLFKPMIEEWRSELEVKLRSGAIKQIMKNSTLSEGRGQTAAKFLADRGWDKRPAGAPSKAEKARKAKIDKSIHHELEDDAERLGLTTKH